MKGYYEKINVFLYSNRAKLLCQILTPLALCFFLYSIIPIVGYDTVHSYLCFLLSLVILTVLGLTTFLPRYHELKEMKVSQHPKNVFRYFEIKFVLIIYCCLLIITVVLIVAWYAFLYPYLYNFFQAIDDARIYSEYSYTFFNLSPFFTSTLFLIGTRCYLGLSFHSSTSIKFSQNFVRISIIFGTYIIQLTPEGWIDLRLVADAVVVSILFDALLTIILDYSSKKLARKKCLRNPLI